MELICSSKGFRAVACFWQRLRIEASVSWGFFEPFIFQGVANKCVLDAS